ncbi:oxidoreductase, 2OG-Fe(II) oxygenase family [Aspergillus tanneri]|uniref:Fe2OG dioxygenase domain-containing protein n=1 Tax=Aspergillus tanneri TaxID=1220188 RepID=A0A5M9MPT0_9EURO|nr:uncharacterized protein ATNIH1004_007992 [Aspergillus tanneri]KAA8646559.1 hypothetical protein ATNIH1004_007992 [Aspergillus tanneri]
MFDKHQLAAQELGMSPSSPSVQFEPTFDTPVEDPTASMLFVEPETSLQCPPQPFQSYLFSETPPVVYVASFVSDQEAQHLIQKSEQAFSPAYVYESGNTQIDTTARKSHTAIPDRDHVVRCIEQRARVNQHWEPGMTVEALSVQRYQENGFFKHHYDSFGKGFKKDRKSTLNVFLHANCTGGGTHFPYLRVPEDKRWCQYIDCESDQEGVTFKPISGNALFWENIQADGTVWPETLHAGMPVLSGTKIGLNIWTWTKDRAI